MSKTFHYHATLDIDVRVRPLTRAFLERRARERRRHALTIAPPIPPSLPSEEELEPQRALQAELCGDEPLLRAWMASGVMLSLREGMVVSDDLDLEDPHDLLPGLAEPLSRATRLELQRALNFPEYAVLLDEFWFSFRTLAPGRIEIEMRSMLPPESDQILGARFRAIVPLTVEVDDVEDVTVGRIVRRRSHSARLDGPFAYADVGGAEPWRPPLPREHELEPTRELLRAAHADPLMLDRIIRLEIVAGVRDGLLADVGPPPLSTNVLKPLIDRLSPAHRAYLLRLRPGEEWADRVWDVADSFDEQTVAMTISQDRA
jgi:hypothetical protein